MELNQYMTQMRIKYLSIATKCALERDEYKKKYEELEKKYEETYKRYTYFYCRYVYLYMKTYHNFPIVHIRDLEETVHNGKK